MAATYLMRTNISNAINKTMWTLYNGTGSAKIIRVYRVFMYPLSSAAVTGGMGIYVMDRFTGVPGGGAAVTLIKHNTASAAVPAQISALDGDTSITGSLTTAGIVRVVCRSNDEVSATSATLEEFQQLHSFGALIYDGGYGDTNVEPIVLRETEGLRMYSTNAGTWGASTFDLCIEMTIT